MVIKVLYVADTFLPKRDGIIRCMLETATRFSNNIKLKFLVPNFAGAAEEAKKKKLDATFCPILRFKIADYPPAQPRSKITAKPIEDADVVCVQLIAPLGASSILQAKKQGKKIVSIVHAIEWDLLAYGTRFPKRATSILRSAARFLYNKVDLIVAADKMVADKLRASGIKTQIKIIPFGIDRKKFKKDLHKRVLMRRKLNIKDSFVIGYLGRLSPEKNIDMLLKAFERTKKKIPNAKLLMIGGGAQEKLVKKKKDVILTGFIENPEDYLQAVDIFVLPSKTETNALSLMEAMATGLPVISSAVGAIPSYVVSGHNGILIAKNSISAEMIANAIEIIHSSPRLRLALAKNAEKTIHGVYDWDQTTRELEKVFKDLAKK